MNDINPANRKALRRAYLADTWVHGVCLLPKGPWKKQSCPQKCVGVRLEPVIILPTATHGSELALRVRIAQSPVHGLVVNPWVMARSELILEELPMNKPLLNALCVSLLAGTSSSFGRADDGSASIAPRTMMAVTVAPSAGAVVIEASTNLV